MFVTLTFSQFFWFLDLTFRRLFNTFLQTLIEIDQKLFEISWLVPRIGYFLNDYLTAVNLIFDQFFWLSNLAFLLSFYTMLPKLIKSG